MIEVIERCELDKQLHRIANKRVRLLFMAGVAVGHSSRSREHGIAIVPCEMREKGSHVTFCLTKIGVLFASR